MAGLTSDMIPRSVYALMYGPCQDSSFVSRLTHSECYAGYSDWSMQPVIINDIDYGSYGTNKTGGRLTLGDLWKDKQLYNHFKFERLVPIQENAKMRYSEY